MAEAAAVATMREILVELQNDETLAKALRFVLTPFVGGARRSGFQRSLEKLQHAAKSKVMMPYQEYEQVCYLKAKTPKKALQSDKF